MLKRSPSFVGGQFADGCFQGCCDFLTVAGHHSRRAQPNLAKEWHRYEFAFWQTAAHVDQISWKYRDIGQLREHVRNAGAELAKLAARFSRSFGKDDQRVPGFD